MLHRLRESVVAEPDHVNVGIDNHLSFSGGRALDRAAHNEFVLLPVPGILSAD